MIRQCALTPSQLAGLAEAALMLEQEVLAEGFLTAAYHRATGKEVTGLDELLAEVARLASLDSRSMRLSRIQRELLGLS